jgi:hypothetical protein
MTKAPDEALRLFRAAADPGYAEAYNAVGDIYYNGVGVPQDRAEALRWYRRGAEAGYATSEVYLGEAYESGDNVPADEALARAWFEKAAEQGDRYGEYNLARFYEEGRGGLAADREQAKLLYQCAADQGVEEATAALARLDGAVEQ